MTTPKVSHNDGVGNNRYAFSNCRCEPLCGVNYSHEISDVCNSRLVMKKPDLERLTASKFLDMSW